MNSYLGLGMALLMAWLALRFALGTAAAGVHALGGVGAAFVALGMRRYTVRRRDASASPGTGIARGNRPPPSDPPTRVIPLRASARRRRLRS